MKYAKVPVNINDKQKYHSKCHQKFTALPKKHRLSVVSEEEVHHSLVVVYYYLFNII